MSLGVLDNFLGHPRPPTTVVAEGLGPDLMNLVGLPSSEPAVTELSDRWFEPIDVDRLQPVDLYQAQLAKRLKKPH